jgi:hypothetical protein
MKIRLFSLIFIFLFTIFVAKSNAAVVGVSPVVSNSAGLSSGLVGYWNFDGKNITRGRINDLSPSGFSMQAFNIATSTFYTFGKIGQSLKFDGSNDYIEYSGKVDNSNTGTITAWVKTPPITTAGEIRGILMYGGNATPNAALFGMRIQNTSGTKQLVVTQRSDGGVTADVIGKNNPSPAIDDDKWHFVSVSSNGVFYNIYIDGVVQTKTIISGIDGGDWFSDTTAAIGGVTRIGAAKSNGTDTQYFNGQIDDVRVYNRELSSTEILRIYNIGSYRVGVSQNINPSLTNCSGINCGLVGYWTFDGKNIENGRINDISGNGFHGNFSGISTTTFYVPGKIGQGGKFDGTDDFFKNDTRVITAYPFTLSIWFKASEVDLSENHMILTLVDKDNSTIQYGIGLDDSGGKGRIVARNTSIFEGLSSQDYDDNKWHHMVGVYNSSTDRILYIDGVSVATSNTSVTYSGLVDNVTVGRWGDSTPDSYFPGNLDDARIYNRGLTATEIQQLYNQGK